MLRGPHTLESLSLNPIFIILFSLPVFPFPPDGPDHCSSPVDLVPGSVYQWRSLMAGSILMFLRRSSAAASVSRPLAEPENIVMLCRCKCCVPTCVQHLLES